MLLRAFGVPCAWTAAVGSDGSVVPYRSLSFPVVPCRSAFLSAAFSLMATERGGEIPIEILIYRVEINLEEMPIDLVNSKVFALLLLNSMSCLVIGLSCAVDSF